MTFHGAPPSFESARPASNDGRPCLFQPWKQVYAYITPPCATWATFGYEISSRFDAGFRAPCSQTVHATALILAAPYTFLLSQARQSPYGGVCMCAPFATCRALWRGSKPLQSGQAWARQLMLTPPSQVAEQGTDRTEKAIPELLVDRWSRHPSSVFPRNQG